MYDWMGKCKVVDRHINQTAASKMLFKSFQTFLGELMPLGDCIYKQFTFIFKLLDLEEMPF